MFLTQVRTSAERSALLRLMVRVEWGKYGGGNVEVAVESGAAGQENLAKPMYEKSIDENTQRIMHIQMGIYWYTTC